MPSLRASFLLAIVLMFGLLMGWQFFFIEPQQRAAREARDRAAEEQARARGLDRLSLIVFEANEGAGVFDLAHVAQAVLVPPAFDCVEAGDAASVSDLLQEAIEATIEATEGPDEREQLSEEFAGFREELGTFQFALTRPYFTTPEKKQAGSGGLFSVTVDPYTCKG